ncbi:MAG: NlpC/P60 family protein [Thermodesulfobacteriota bacterium]
MKRAMVDGTRIRQRTYGLIGLVILLLLFWGCGRPALRDPSPMAESPERRAVPRLGYTIQTGAFARVENAARMARALQDKGLDATYFAAQKGLYKVRFGNFAAREEARVRAQEMRQAGIIEEFYIVTPDEHPAAKRAEMGEAYLREALVRSARNFLGVPYLWGGVSVEMGFDCSGLTMTVYQLNGFDLPRTSREQFAAGRPVDRASLKQGDLLFFSRGGGRVSHVGIYAGGDRFIHAPGKGQRIRVDVFSRGQYGRMYAGARSYL